MSTQVPFGDPKAQNRFAGVIAREIDKKSFWSSKLMGRGENSRMPVQQLTELENDAGDRISFELMAELRSNTIEDDNVQQGTEAPMQFYTSTVFINQARQGVNAGGAMARKRTAIKLRERAKTLLSDYWPKWFDQLCFMYASGARGINQNYFFPLDFQGRANNAMTAPDANHQFFGGTATAFNNITSSDKITRAFIERLSTRANMQGGGASGIPTLQPVILDGQSEEHYVMVMSPEQENDLRNDPATGNWLDLQKAAAGREGNNSRLFKNNLGMIKDVLLHSHKNVVRFNNAGAGANVNAHRALFLGAQALVCAYGSPGTGMRYSWYEEARDNGNQKIVSTSTIMGLVKTRYTTPTGPMDFGVFAADTAITPV